MKSSMDGWGHLLSTTNGWIKTQGSESGLSRRSYKIMKSGTWVNPDLIRSTNPFCWKDMDQYELPIPEEFFK